MVDHLNPYESPLPVGEYKPPAKPPQREAWKFVLLGIAILGGLFSFYPRVAIILTVVSAPVFLRYAVRASVVDPVGTPQNISRKAATAVGLFGMAVSIIAASAGAFLGTCTLTGYASEYSGLSDAIAMFMHMKGHLPGLALSMRAGIGAGSVAFLFALVWLWRRNHVFPFTTKNRDPGTTK
jgi:hypothetical protein